MNADTVKKLMAILGKLRQDVPVTPAGVALRHAMDRTILSLDAFRSESAGGSCAGPNAAETPSVPATKSAGRD